MPIGALLLAGAVAAGACLPWLSAPLLAALGFVLWFFRDPERRSDAPPEALLCPADGKVVEIASVEEPEHIGGPAQKVAVFMSLLDVHVNRSPCDATVEWTRHEKGRFLHAMRSAAGLENERVLVAMRRDGKPLLLKLVAGLVARRIVCRLQPNERLSRGQRIGMIQFGSRVEVFVPRGEPFEVAVKLGQHVRAGETILGYWK